jgi:O-antigen ligase
VNEVLVMQQIDVPRSRFAEVMSVSPGQFAVGVLYFLILNIASDGGWSTVISGLIPALFLAPLIYLLAWREGWHRYAAVPGTTLLGVTMVAFAFFAVLSAIANPLPKEAWLPVLGAYVMPAMLFYSISVVRLSEVQAQRCLVLVAVGAAVPLGLGAIEFLREYGFPTGADLLMSRYDNIRMQGYMGKTFGNTGNMAAFLAIIVPTVGAALLTLWRKPGARVLLAGILILAFLHVLIVQSRTLFIVLTLIFPVIALFYRLRFGAILVAAFVTIAAIVIPVLTAVDQFFENTVVAAAGLNEDNSVSERIEAMRAALSILKDHLAFGVGPGNSLNINPYTSAHEYILQQGSEIGIIGVLLAILLTAAYLLRGWDLFRSRARDHHSNIRFAMMIGPIAFFVYGVIANIPLSQTILVTWIGLASLLAGASFMQIMPVNPVEVQSEISR